MVEMRDTWQLATWADGHKRPKGHVFNIYIYIYYIYMYIYIKRCHILYLFTFNIYILT
jgi:hypothetical protein